MEYIDVNQFLEQPEEVQQVLKEYHNEYYNYKIFNPKTIPIIDETELRHFIEDKLDGKIDCTFWKDCYEICVFNKDDCDAPIKTYIINEVDLLQVYWQVACEIAKEAVN